MKKCNVWAGVPKYFGWIIGIPLDSDKSSESLKKLLDIIPKTIENKMFQGFLGIPINPEYIGYCNP